MKSKLLLIFGLFLLLFSCSIDKMQPEPLVINGVDGKSSLAKVTNVPAGVNCANGGVRLDFGLDSNLNGKLDDEEILSTAYTCNGIDGKNGVSNLVEVKAIDGNLECPNGGVLVVTGIDKNANGVIDTGELVSSVVVCSGIDGKSSTIKTEEVKATETSPGGHWLHFYENDVIVKSIFISNGINGKDGINGIDGIDGKNGVSVSIRTEQVENGYNLYVTSSTGTETLFLRNGTNGTNGLDGLNGIDGVNGTNGTNGVSSLIRSEKVDPSFQYPYGGYFLYVTVGTTTEKIFVSNGANGANGLNGTNGTNGLSTVYNVIPNSPNSSSTTIQLGYDRNGNGNLDSNEIIDNIVVSNGVDGTDGTDGTDGSDGTNGTDGLDGLDGINSFIYVYTEVPVEFCEFGGYVVVTGMDTNRNGVLDESESNYTYICDCGCPEGDDSKKVAICHKTKIGNDWKFVTLYVPQSAVPAHLDHGDELGKCN